MKKIKALFFDFDGTLYHLEINWEKLKREVFQRLEKDYDDSLSLTRIIYEIKEKKLKKEIFDFLRKEEMKGVVQGYPIEGAKDFLLVCQKKGIKTGIISRNSHQSIEIAIRKADFPPFEIIIGREDVEFPKPHSEGLLKALGAFKFSPLEVLYIGDSKEIDGKFAQKAGVKFIFFRNWKEVKIWE